MICLVCAAYLGCFGLESWPQKVLSSTFTWGPETTPPLPCCALQVLGVAGDALKAKFPASSGSGSYIYWDSGAVFSASIAFVTYSALKFAVYTDKSLGQ